MSFHVFYCLDISTCGLSQVPGCVAFDLDGLLWQPSLAQLQTDDLELHLAWPKAGATCEKTNKTIESNELDLN